MGPLKIAVLGALLCSAVVWGQGIQADRAEPWTPEEELASFTLADGFVAELVVSEKNGLINPIDLTFDDAGRLWTQTARMYPMDPITDINFGKAMKMMRDPALRSDPRFLEMLDRYQLKTPGRDQILILEDLHQGLDKPLKVWADDLTIPQSIMPYKDGCYVAHGSELFFLEDKNKDGRQDSMTPVLTGFGFFDTHTMAHTLVRAPGGWINFSHGAINSGKVKALKSGAEQQITYCKNARFSLDGEQLELVNAGLNNIWGYQLLGSGQWYGTEANDKGFSVTPMEAQTGFEGIGNDKIRSYQPFFPAPNNFRVGRTGISGLAFSEDGSKGFPTEWKNVAFLANPLTQSINCVRIVRNPDGTVSSEHLSDLLKSSDEWFRPVNIEFGPDGCLYVADWYNKIISHNEVTTDHPDRDRSHGRIWRIRHKSQKTISIPNVAKASNIELLKHLKGETLWEKQAAWHQIVDRQAVELEDDLIALLQEASLDPRTQIAVLWALEGIGGFSERLWKTMLSSSNDDLRREAVRALASFDIPADQVAALVKDLLEDDNVMLRSQVLRTLDEIHKASDKTIELLVHSCKPAAPNNSMGGNYERNFERFLARKALERYPNELKQFLAKEAGASMPAENILWALQALPVKERSPIFVSIWEKASAGGVDVNTFAAITKMLADSGVRQAVEPNFKAKRESYLNMGLENIQLIDGPALASMYHGYISELLQSEDKAKAMEGLNIVLALHSAAHTSALKKLLPGFTEGTQEKVLVAIGYDRSVSAAYYRQLLYNDQLPMRIRIQALAAFVLKDAAKAKQDVKSLIVFLSYAEKKQLVQTLSKTAQGVDLLSHLWEISYLENSDWDFNAAKLAQELRPGDWRVQELVKFTEQVELAAEQGRKEKVQAYAELIPTLKGNKEVGKSIFMACAACHKPKPGGVHVAPPIEGAGKGNLEHLLTAIINPDEAVEGAYARYQVVRKDGSFVEGFLVKSDAAGVSIGYLGGTSVFITRSQILREGNVNKRSFMPNGFGVLPAQTLADLIEYLK